MESSIYLEPGVKLMTLSPLFKKVLPYLFLIVFGFLLYYQSLFFSFSYLDDNQLIINNQGTLRQGGIANIFTSDVFFSNQGSGFYYRPLLNVSILIDSYFGGIEPFTFHYTNLILHLLAACLVFALLKQLLASKKTAFFLSLIFLVHPALTQAVTWIPGRNDSLLTVFILSAFLFFINFLRTDRIIYWWGHLFFFILAVFTKETAIFLPLLCLAYYFLDIYKFKSENSRNNFIIIFTTWATCLIIWSLLRSVSLSGSSSLQSIIMSELNNLPVLFMYLGKAFLPYNLGVYPTLKDSTYWFGIFAVILLAISYFKTAKLNWRRLIFGTLWFLVFLLPSFIRPNSTPTDFLEHRLYLPIIGLLIIMAELYPLKEINWSVKKNKYLAAILILLFSGLTFWHSRNFIDRLSFWNKAVSDSPQSAFVNNNLGSMYYLDGNLNQAQKYYFEAARLNPNQELVHNNLGLVAFNLDKFEIAESEYKKEIAINPSYDITWSNLGLLYLKTKRPDMAIGAFNKALQINPNNNQAYNNLLILSSKVE